jgi:hypothetical protein
MAKNYKPADAANTAVRAFLYGISERKYKKYLLTDKAWKDICKLFDDRCAYCGKEKSLQREHLYECNQEHGGLHVCGNVIPACGSCNQEKNKVSFKEKVKQIKLYKAREFQEHQKKYTYPMPKNQKKINDDAKKLYGKVLEMVTFSLK